MNMLKFTSAIDVFTKSFAFLRSLVYPAEAIRHGPLWVVRDMPRKRANDYRMEEIFAYNIAAEEILLALSDYAAQHRYALGVFINAKQTADPIKSVLKLHGYRLWFTESFFVCDIASVANVARQSQLVKGAWAVRRAESPEEAARAMRSAVGASQALRPEHFGKPWPALRLYYVEENGEPIGSIRSVHLQKNAAWVNNLVTDPKHRRRGVGSALIRSMLRDDAAYGAKYSVLLSSHIGALTHG
jgi:GNAT superfamily N-acetyltransferase